MSAIYKGRSVAEQNSLDLAWNLLLEADFDALRTTLCADDAELSRFRQLVVNSVMATDLGDKELKELRNARWEKAFSSSGKMKTDDEESSKSSFLPMSEIHTSSSGRCRDDVNRKATIVIEHLIQVSQIDIFVRSSFVQDKKFLTHIPIQSLPPPRLAPFVCH